MSYNHTKNYFDFKGRRYGIGTIVRIKPERFGCEREINRCNGIAEFVCALDNGYIKFKGIVPRGEANCWIGWIANPEDKIERIISPIYYVNKTTLQTSMENYKKTHPKMRPDIAPGTIFYIAAMIVLAIFKDRLIGWIIATFLYVKYLVDIYRD